MIIFVSIKNYIKNNHKYKEVKRIVVLMELNDNKAETTLPYTDG